MTATRQAIATLRENISRVFLGHPSAVDRVLTCLLARGHILIEDVPGVGKTVLATALARSIDCAFSRIQLTPDLLPSDILGVTILHRDPNTGATSFEFKEGPIFANIILADEINRTPPRTQTALLEAMGEAAVSIDGKTRRLSLPFMVIATQNPLDFEGTYPLPENQLDRFLMRINVGYPTPTDEAQVLVKRPADTTLRDLAPVMHARDVVELQERVDAVRMEQALVEYIIEIARATRNRDDLALGLSPRGSLALAHAARATAVLHGREYVVPQDIVGNVISVCAHRLITRGYAEQGYRAELSLSRNAGGGSDQDIQGSYPPGSAAAILSTIVKSIPSPE